MTDQMVFLGLNQSTTSPSILVSGSAGHHGRRTAMPVSEGAIVVAVNKAHRQLRNPASDRLAAIRERVARLRREYPAYPDTPEEQAEQLRTLEAFAPLQAEAILSMGD